MIDKFKNTIMFCLKNWFFFRLNLKTVLSIEIGIRDPLARRNNEYFNEKIFFVTYIYLLVPIYV